MLGHAVGRRARVAASRGATMTRKAWTVALYLVTLGVLLLGLLQWVNR